MKTLLIDWLGGCDCGCGTHVVLTEKGNEGRLYDEDKVICKDCGSIGSVAVDTSSEGAWVEWRSHDGEYPLPVTEVEASLSKLLYEKTNLCFNLTLINEQLKRKLDEGKVEDYEKADFMVGVANGIIETKVEYTDLLEKQLAESISENTKLKTYNEKLKAQVEELQHENPIIVKGDFNFNN